LKSNIIFIEIVCFKQVELSFDRETLCDIYICWLCLFCLIRKKLCWGYFAFSRTRLVAVVTW